MHPENPFPAKEILKPLTRTKKKKIECSRAYVRAVTKNHALIKDEYLFTL